MKKFFLITIFSSFFMFGFAHAEELKPTIWKIDEQHIQSIKNWNMSAFKEISEQKNWAESEFIKNLNLSMI